MTTGHSSWASPSFTLDEASQIPESRVGYRSDILFDIFIAISKKYFYRKLGPDRFGGRVNYIKGICCQKYQERDVAAGHGPHEPRTRSGLECVCVRVCVCVCVCACVRVFVPSYISGNPSVQGETCATLCSVSRGLHYFSALSVQLESTGVTQ